MTKSGSPSRLNDIRYFYGSQLTYLEGFAEATAFGRRLAWWLNGAGMTIGAHTAMYVYFTSDLPEDVIEVTQHGYDWWHRYVNVGIPKDFLSRLDSHDRIVGETVACLMAAAEDYADAIQIAVEKVQKHADSLRFLLKSQDDRHRNVEVTCTITAWPKPSLLFVSFTDRADGRRYEAPAVEIQMWHHLPLLTGKVTFDGNTVTLEPKPSFTADFTSKANGGPFSWRLEDFVAIGRPETSGLLKLHA